MIGPERVLINLIVSVFTIYNEKSCRPKSLVVLITRILASHFVAILLNAWGLQFLFHVHLVIGKAFLRPADANTAAARPATPPTISGILIVVVAGDCDIELGGGQGHNGGLGDQLESLLHLIKRQEKRLGQGDRRRDGDGCLLVIGFNSYAVDMRAKGRGGIFRCPAVKQDL